MVRAMITLQQRKDKIEANRQADIKHMQKCCDLINAYWHERGRTANAVVCTTTMKIFSSVTTQWDIEDEYI